MSLKDEMPESACLDENTLNALIALSAGSSEECGDLVESFLTSLSRRYADLARSLESGDAPGVDEARAQLRGTLLGLCAEDAVDACEKLDMPKLETELQRVLERLGRLV